MGIDDMMYPGRPIPAELIERYYIPMPVTRAADRRREYITARQAALHDQARYQAQDMADGSLHLGLIGFQPPSHIHPGATRYAHDLPRSPYYRSSI
jgi:hypothetical protein